MSWVTLSGAVILLGAVLAVVRKQRSGRVPAQPAADSPVEVEALEIQEEPEVPTRLVLTLPAPHGKSTLPAARGLLRSFLEVQIRRDTSRQLARYCPELGRAPTGVKLRPLKSLWGSLDTRDRVTLDLALALAPPAALRYVVVHELCHLRIRSHSPRYWALVESHLPDWREQREWLRLNGQALKAELNRLIANDRD